MAVSPSVINKIKWVLFTKEEPPTSGVVWAKPEGDSFIFYAYDNGAWTDIAGTPGVIIPSVSAYLSAFINDAGFLVAADLSNYTTSDDVASAISTALASYYTGSEVDALLSNFITKSVDDLVNYYLKSDTYTKTEVQTLINAVKQFTYEVVQTLPTATADTMHKIYLVPSADPQTQNIKNEYITIDNGAGAQTRYTWEQIGSTAIDLSGYVTTTALNTALADYTTTADLTTLLSNYQSKIDSTHKLSADLVDDTNTTNKFTNATEKQTWNGKQDALTFNTTPSSSNKVATMADVPTTMGASGSGHKGGLVPDTPSTAGTTKFLREDGTWAEPAGGGGTSSIMGPSGPNHASGLTPDTPSTAGTTKFLREDGTWQVPAAPVTSVNGQTGDVVLPIPDVTTKEDKVTIESASGTTLTAQVGKYYTMSNVGTLAITLPTIASGTTTVQTITFYITAGSTPAVTFSSTHSIHKAKGFEIAANSTYEVSAAWNGIAWVVTSVEIEIPSA